MEIIHLTKEQFSEKVFNKLNGGDWNYLGDKPALIDFFATWCGPCKALSPVLESVAAKFDQVYIYKVDVDQEPELANLFNIRSVPTLLFIPMEGKLKMHTGLISQSDLEYAIKHVLL